MTAKDAMEQRDEMLNEYEKGIQMPAHEAPGTNEELEKYLTMDRTVLESIASEECSIIEYRLGQFAFYLQRAQNRELARVTWAKNELRLSIAKELNDYKGYGYEALSSQAIKGNEHATKVNQILVYAQQRADRLNFLSNGLRNLGDILKSMSYNRRQSSHE